MLNNPDNSRPEPKNVIDYSLHHLQVRLIHFEAIGSTNTYLKDVVHALGHENLPGGHAICALADEQTAGRGRMDRTWHSPRGEGLYFSILFKPELNAVRSPLLTLMAAVVAAESINETCPADRQDGLDIKWPNDILVNGKKTAGILTEAGFESDRMSYAVIGFGVNLNQGYFPEEIGGRATSLYLETGKKIDREEFLLILLSNLSRWYGISVDAPERIIERWQQLSSFARGKIIRVEMDGRMVRARTVGLDSCGALRAETDDGQAIILYGGEITLDGE